MACGTGAAASFVILKKKGLCDNKIEVKLELGKIKLSYNENKEILMEGPAVCIAHNIEIDLINM